MLDYEDEREICFLERARRKKKELTKRKTLSRVRRLTLFGVLTSYTVTVKSPRVRFLFRLLLTIVHYQRADR